jgi:hypothetical protein
MTTHQVNAQASTTPVASLKGVRRRSILKRHPVLFPIIVIIALMSPFLGLVLNGWTGVGVGLAINVAALFLGFRAVMLIVNEYEFRA